MSRVRVGRGPRTGLRWIRMIEDEMTTSGCTVGGMGQSLKKLGASNFCVRIKYAIAQGLQKRSKPKI